MVFVSLSSFGATQVLSQGQAAFSRLASMAGADGIEVRGELLKDLESEIPDIVAASPDLPKVFSHDKPLFSVNGQINSGAIQSGLAIARTLGAKRLKMSLGDVSNVSVSSLHALDDVCLGSCRQEPPIELLVENDQSSAGGTIIAMTRFFALADAAGVDVGMTFDLGNWHWTGECPLAAAGALCSRVRYVHCKGVQRRSDRWVAVPLNDSSAPWRTVLRALPRGTPRAIEYPLCGADLLSIAKHEVSLMREIAEGEV